MRKIFLLSIVSLLGQTIFCQMPMYQADFYFEDAVGNRDTITIGYDTTANGEFNPKFGEINLTQPFDSVFEVRATQRTGFNWGQGSYILSKRIFDLGEKYANLPQCTSGGSAICFIRAKYPPVTISWDINIMDNQCNRASFWTPDLRQELVHPYSWFGYPYIRYGCASDNSDYVIQLGAIHKSQGEISYVIKHEVEGSSNVKDTIYGVLFSGFMADWWFSPCSLVDSEEPSTQAEALILCPNPVFDKIMLQNEVTNDHIIQIFDSTGRSMRYVKRTGGEGALDVADLQQGWYFLRIIDESGRIQVGSFQKL
jgi:Secretion system C-terminal sorting domain